MKRLATITFQDRQHFVGVVAATLGFFFFTGLVFQFDVGNLPALRFSSSAVLILPGAFLVVAGVFRRQAGNYMTLAGGLMVGAGLVLLAQMPSGAWLTWLYAWALAFPVAAGIALITQGVFTRQAALCYSGLRSLLLGLSAFVAGFLFFELFLNLSGVITIGTPIARGLALVLVAGLAGALLVWMLKSATELPTE